MKINLNNKILLLTSLGLLPIPTISNAQTFYQCMPLSCSDGQYIKDGKCTSCPAGTYQKGNDRATSCSPCSAGTYSSTGASSCSTCPAGYYCPGGTDKKWCSSGYYAKGGASSCTRCSNVTVTLDYLYRNVSNTGGCYQSKNFHDTKEITLSPGYNSINSFGFNFGDLQRRMAQQGSAVYDKYSLSFKDSNNPIYRIERSEDGGGIYGISYDCDNKTGSILSIIAR
ncbi:MAG: hypothetical protein ACI4N3_03185 [Alphaproteobacteria bacterium]